MTLRDDERDRDEDQRVMVAPGVPTDRVRWGPILAGTFAALTMLAVLSTLGTAIGLSAYDPGQDDPRTFAQAGGIWGIIALILSFAFGGWLAARAAAIRGRSNGVLNGFMVAGVGIPLMLFILGSMTAAMGSAATQAISPQTQGGALTDEARTAAGTVTGEDVVSVQTPTDITAEDARVAASRTAWGTLIGLVLAISAAAAAGAVGARTDHDDDRYDRGRYTAATTTTTTPPTTPTL